MSNLHQSVIDQVHARIGRTLKDKWHVDALIGMGGMAAVYSATHRTGSRVAIKMLHPALSMNDSVRKRFAREGYVANTIGHSGVARVLDDDVAEDGSAFIVMELLEGETVASRAERCGGKLNPSEVAYIGEAVCDVLASAHKSKIIHRDIKPDNIFVTNEGRVVVLDFGIARLVDGGMGESSTRTGTMMGTPAFMPPEQARGRANEMDASSDVWALGATLFWLASGRVVHEAETPNEQLVAAATLPAASLSRFAPNFPGPIAEVIDKALEYTKESRFHDADAMKQALHAAVLTVSWGAGTRPSLDPSTAPPPGEGDETVVEIGKPLKPLAPRLPLSGDDAPTIDTRSARGPTIGPVEMAPPPKRGAQYVKAAIIGLVAAVVLLGVTTIVAKKINPPVAAATTDSVVTPTPIPTPSPTLTASATPSQAASAVASVTASASADPTASVHPLMTAATAHPPHPVPTATSRNNWLDRRK